MTLEGARRAYADAVAAWAAADRRRAGTQRALDLVVRLHDAGRLAAADAANRAAAAALVQVTETLDDCEAALVAAIPHPLPL